MSDSKKATFKKSARTRQRNRALDVLFEADARGLRGSELSQLLDERGAISTAQEPIGEYGKRIVATYTEWADDVDSMIEAASPNWSLDRMSTVDRNLLRIGATELMYLDVARPIVIKEITALVKEFSEFKAVGFVMGVLNRIAEIREAETAGDSTVSHAESEAE